MQADLRIPAVVARGGTSKCVTFKAADLPSDLNARDRIILAALGSPDPYGCQFVGLGGRLCRCCRGAGWRVAYRKPIRRRSRRHGPRLMLAQ
ncbi:MAG: PrpF domain-containing protein [Hyphomicrobiaceae bacterium]